MSLSSLQLDAFVTAAKEQGFSKAAKKLHITQSALSQRILNLEEELGSTLFIRESSGIRLTELGQKLLRYSQMKDSLEDELLGSFKAENQKSLVGTIRLGGFSTVMRSILVPSLLDLISKNPQVQIECFTREMRELPALLETGEADFILLNRVLEKPGIENIRLGFEENVLVEPKGKKFREEVFLDHDSEDSTTADFFKLQNKIPQNWKRSYLDEVYAIVDGVLEGLGRAVIPLHLVKQIKGLKVSPGYRSVKTPVYFCYYRQAFYTLLQKQVINEVSLNAPKLL